MSQPFTCPHRLPVRPGSPFSLDQCRPCWIDAGGDHRVPVAGVKGRTPQPPPAVALAVPQIPVPAHGPAYVCYWCTSERVWKWLAYTDGWKKAEGRHAVELEARLEAETALGTDIAVNMGAGGLGDGIQGLWVSKAVQAANPTRDVTYRCGDRAVGFVKLFDGYDHLASHESDQGGHLLLGPPALQLNAGYVLQEQMGRAAEPRMARYLRNAGVAAPVRPELRDAARIRNLGAPWAGCVVLAPLSAGSDREYSLPGWRAVERLLRAEGLRTVIPHADVVTLDRPGAERLRGFASELVLDRPPEEVAALVLNAGCVVGIDSGLMHLAGALGTPAVVLCGQTRGDRVFDHCPSVRPLDGLLGCGGCYWQPSAGWDKGTCTPSCPNLQSIAPARVVALVREALRG